MVVMCLPAAARIGVRQLRAAAPFTCTVHAPHRPMPHPNFVPVSARSSRRYQSNGIAGSPSKRVGLPFTVSWIIGFSSCHCLCAQSLVSGKVLCGGQQTLSIQCRGGNLSGKRFEPRAAENWAGAPLPRFSTMRDAHRPVRFLRVDRPSPSPGVSEMRGPLRRSSSAEEAFLLGSVLGDGLRATDLPREPAGHRSLPPIRDRETLSPGFS